MGKGRRSVLPGFRLALGYSAFYVVLLVIVPLSTLFLKTATLSFAQLTAALGSPRVLSAFKLSFGASLTAAAVDAVLGLLVAWVLVRYEFPGRRLFDAAVDLPFALPTAVAGIALTTLFTENGWIGRLLSRFDIQVAFTKWGIVAALTFVGLPFVVRAVQPVLSEFEEQVEEAAASLGASRLQIAVRVILPMILPAVISGFAQAFARGVGEYGSVVFISGNMPMRTEIVPLLIMSKLEQFDYAGATALASMMLLLSFVLLFLLNHLQRWQIHKWSADSDVGAERAREPTTKVQPDVIGRAA